MNRGRSKVHNLRSLETKHLDIGCKQKHGGFLFFCELAIENQQHINSFVIYGGMEMTMKESRLGVFKITLKSGFTVWAREKNTGPVRGIAAALPCCTRAIYLCRVFLVVVNIFRSLRCLSGLFLLVESRYHSWFSFPFRQNLRLNRRQIFSGGFLGQGMGDGRSSGGALGACGLTVRKLESFLVFGTKGGLDRGTGMGRRGFNAIGMTALSALFCSSGEWGCYEHYAGGGWGEYERVACREGGIADRVLIMSGL